MTRIKNVSVFSLAKLQAILLGLLGVIAGILYSFGGLIIDTLVTFNFISTTETPGLSFGTVLAFGALIGMPLIFASIGFILGLLEAIIYNLFSQIFGGLDLNFGEIFLKNGEVD